VTPTLAKPQSVATPVYGQNPQIPFAPPSQKKSGGIPKWAWVVGAVALIAIIAAIASAGGSKKDDNAASTVPSTASSATPKSSVPAAKAPAKAPDHAEDVKITACTADTVTGFLQAAVTVTNNSSKTSNYAITIAFESKDGARQLDTGLVAVNDLNSGQSSDQTALGLSAAPAAGYSCKLADITRYAS
jgi:hypothetical protein